MKATHISIRKETALEFLKGDDTDGDFDYDSYTDSDLFDAFVGAGYFQNESEIYGTTFVASAPPNCIDSVDVGLVTGWPVSLEDYYDTSGPTLKINKKR